MTNFGLFFADSVAALVVALIVIVISYRLGKRSIEVLLDYAPPDKVIKIEGVMKSIREIDSYHSLKVRKAGADTFVKVVVSINPGIEVYKAHEICNKAEQGICGVINRCDVMVHVEPFNQNL